MSFTHRIKRGSTRPVLRYPLPSGVDLTGASAVLIMSPRPGQPATVNAPAVIASIASAEDIARGSASPARSAAG